MKEATPEEIQERYRELPDYELWVVAADASQLTPAAAAALHQELRNRKLSEGEVAKTRASLQQWRAKEPQYTPAPFDLRTQIVGASTSLVRFLAIIAVWLLVDKVTRRLRHSPESAEQLEKIIFIACFVLYGLWQLVAAVKKIRRKKSLGNTSHPDSG